GGHALPGARLTAMAVSDSLAPFLRRPILTILVYGGLLAWSVHALLAIPVEVLPRFELPQIAVITHVPGATARDLETLVTRPLEGELLALPDIVDLRSVMGNGVVETDIRFVSASGATRDLAAVNGAIDRARGALPAGVSPYAQIMGNAINEVADYTAAIPPGVAPDAVQRAVLTRIVPALRALPGVQRVEVYGAGDEALLVAPRPEAMRRYGVGIGAIMAALRNNAVLGSTGYLTLGHQDVPVGLRALPRDAAALAAIPVAGPEGKVPLGALADVSRGPMPTHNAVLLDGRRAVALTVFKQPGASTLPVTRAVRALLAESRGQLPAGVRWVRFYDQGHLVGLIGADLGRNLMIGGVLAAALLVWILGTGRGIWVLVASIPLSLLLGIACLHALGQSLDLMTLGALTVAIGILADDAIIVLESIYHRFELGETGWAGIRNGLLAIAGPDVTGTLTVVAVFAPFLFTGGVAGLFFVPFALAMSCALLASLFVSLTFIPLALGFIGAAPARRVALGARVAERLRAGNARLLDLTLRFPRLGLGLAALVLLGGIAGLALVPVTFLPLPNEGVLLESFSLTPGSALTEAEAAVRGMIRRLRRDPAVAHLSARIGSAASTAYTEPAYAGEIQIALRPGVNAGSLDRIGARVLRESRLPGVQLSLDTPTIERVGESLAGLPQPFVIRLFGERLGVLRSLARRVAARLRHVAALSDVIDDDAYPVTVLEVRPRPAALAAHGTSAAAIRAALRPLLGGEVAATVPEGGYPLPIFVRLDRASTLSVNALRGLPIGAAGGVPLGQLADVTIAVVPDQLRHLDGARALDILASPTGTPGAAIAATRRALAGLALPRGYRIGFGGLYPELERAALGLGIAAIASFALMAGILALQFAGWLAPFVLLLQIPLGFAGGAVALSVSGVGLNAAGLIAFVTLIGLSLRQGIVLLDYARRGEAEGLALEAAVREAVRVRFRPILLTTLTAALGMLPTALGWGQGAAPEQGLAIVILGGIVWSALLSTNLLPALYLRWRRGR
ncbi:MAG: efflux RND transporter permease subunit, partial [Rhodospirillales bacterium]|nr:efflux RND transporter permease subunit [Rhodospirillales bacterium]